MSLTWRPWNELEFKGGKPGGPVTAVPWGTDVFVFFCNGSNVQPSSSVFVAMGDPFADPINLNWSNSGVGMVPPSVPLSSPVTAIPWGNRLALFVTDQQGSIYQNIGYPQSINWGNWTPVAQGSSIPGATVTAQIWGNYVVLFMADSSGGVYQCSGDPNDGSSWGSWTLIPDLNVKSGSPITAVISYPDSNQLALFVTDQEGNINMNTGYPQTDNWVGWTPVGQGSFVPGGAVTVVRWINNVPALFAVDVHGSIYTTSPPTLPSAPSGLHVTVSSQQPNSSLIKLGWTDNSDNETGFKVSFEAIAGTGIALAPVFVPANAMSYSFPLVDNGTTYSVNVQAYNAEGASVSSDKATSFL